MDVLPVNRRDERLVQIADDGVRDGIARGLDPLDLTSLAINIVIGLHHLLQQPAADDHVLSRLVKQLKKGDLPRKKIKHTHSM